MDKALGEVLDALEKRGIADNTLLVFTSDQGEHMPFAKFGVYDAGLRVPFIVRWPGKVKPGTVTDAMVSLADLLPTFLEAGGGSIPEEEIDGRSIMPVLTGKKKTHHKVIFGGHSRNTNGPLSNQCFNSARMIRTPTHQYIINLYPEMKYRVDYWTRDYWPSWEEKAKTDEKAKEILQRHNWRPKEELYDVIKDPYELNNLADNPEYAELKAKLKQQLLESFRQQGDEDGVNAMLKKGR